METDHSSVGVIYTGGTFGMVPSGRGYVPSDDLPERAATALHERGLSDLPALDWLDSPWPPLNSGDLEPRFWFDLARVIADAAGGHDGFVVIHGTDTLAFTGSALSFLLAGLGKPVVVTGASTPLVESGSDAFGNLLNALRVASSRECAEATVVFGDRVLRANRTTKRHGDAANPFSSPALAPLAELNDTVTWRAIDPLPSTVARDLPVAAWRDSRVALLSIYPGITGDVVRALRDTGIGGLVLEGYSAGIGPGGNEDFVRALEETVAGGVVVGAVSQSRGGRVRLGKYAVSTPLAEAGVIGGADMTREAAIAKLHVLLARGGSPADVAAAFCTDLRGELSPDI